MFFLPQDRQCHRAAKITSANQCCRAGFVVHDPSLIGDFKLFISCLSKWESFTKSFPVSIGKVDLVPNRITQSSVMKL